NHNQSLELLTYYLDHYLDSFDYYVVTPHFPLDSETQAGVLKQLDRIPHRKLIMLDRLQPGFPGNYGAVYQDFESDIYGGLAKGIEKGAGMDCRLKVITLPESLYGSIIRSGVEHFCMDYQIPVSFYHTAPDNISRGDIFLVLNSQLDEGLVGLVRKISARGLTIGKDVKIISYNEFPMNELVLGGLTTVSTDFWEMGRLAADMVAGHKLYKIHCPFRMMRRHTF
ncbi:MAG: LacI family DNA-binding transcriptional regulator, partial [Bacteroidales bacterium]|nr:LacI family DNA-binding transcriptional regulator [Bacteroidales bacterium]